VLKQKKQKTLAQVFCFVYYKKGMQNYFCITNACGFILRKEYRE
tara:strand:+ start:988 stop:1119 length:132 start_codon:yes stop_codon:yes gene_type:complete